MAKQVTVDDLGTWLKVNGIAGDQTAAQVVAATNSFVSSLPSIRKHPETGDWHPDTILGATMLAARLWRRRNSPNGVEAVTEAGTSFVARYDSDISRLLRLDGYGPARIG